MVALKERMQRPAAVPCDGCTACCHKDRVILSEAERSAFRWHPEWDGRLGELAVLDRQADGACVYLAADGCSVHGAQPDICRRMDCRTLYANTTPAQREARVRQNVQMIHVYTAGAERLHTLGK